MQWIHTMHVLNEYNIYIEWIQCIYWTQTNHVSWFRVLNAHRFPLPRWAFICVTFIYVICASNQPCGSMAQLHGLHSKQSSLLTASSTPCLFLILFLLWCFNPWPQESPLLPTHLQMPQAATSNTVTLPRWGSPPHAPGCIPLLKP